MKDERFSRHLLIAFLLSVTLYVVGYWFIESRRVTDTPWVVGFQSGTDGQMVVDVHQTTLSLGPVRIHIQAANTNLISTRQELAFDQPKPVPFPVPGGNCVFQDTTFLPGTVALEISGVPIQFLPRAITVGTNEFAWSSNALIIVPQVGPAHARQ